MKKLLVVAVFVALGAVVYAKVLRDSPQERACEKLATLCGAKADAGACAEGLDELEDVVGEKVVDKAADCISDANTCVEAIGCMAGAGTHLVEEFERGFERGRQ